MVGMEDVQVAMQLVCSYLAHELGTNVFHRVLQLNLLGDCDTIVDNPGRAVLALQHHIPSLLTPKPHIS